MKKVLKWIGIVLVVLIGLIFMAGIGVVFASNQKANQVYEVETAVLTIPTDEASIAEGKRIIAYRACADCHNADFSGSLFLDDPAIGTFYATNLTAGTNSPTANFTPADWDRAIRHGIDPNGQPLAIMPSTDYYRISDEDLSKMIAYLQSLPPVDQDAPAPDPAPGPLGRVLIAANQIPYSAALIDHNTPPPTSVVAEVSEEYGSYLATTCTGCHGMDFSGGPIVGLPDSPPAANLTPAGHLADWTQEAFINTLRTGTTPEGKALNPAYMPWPITSSMSDDELAAIWLYLQTVSPVETDP
jgi:cytochrome c553